MNAPLQRGLVKHGRKCGGECRTTTAWTCRLVVSVRIAIRMSAVTSRGFLRVIASSAWRLVRLPEGLVDPAVLEGEIDNSLQVAREVHSPLAEEDHAFKPPSALEEPDLMHRVLVHARLSGRRDVVPRHGDHCLRAEVRRVVELLMTVRPRLAL